MRRMPERERVARGARGPHAGLFFYYQTRVDVAGGEPHKLRWGRQRQHFSFQPDTRHRYMMDRAWARGANLERGSRGRTTRDPRWPSRSAVRVHQSNPQKLQMQHYNLPGLDSSVRTGRHNPHQGGAAQPIRVRLHRVRIQYRVQLVVVGAIRLLLL